MNEQKYPRYFRQATNINFSDGTIYIKISPLEEHGVLVKKYGQLESCYLKESDCVQRVNFKLWIEISEEEATKLCSFTIPRPLWKKPSPNKFFIEKINNNS